MNSDAELRPMPPDRVKDSEAIRWLSLRGYVVRHRMHMRDSGPSEYGYEFESSELNRLETLALAGQTEAARLYALELMSEAIGRKLT